MEPLFKKEDIITCQSYKGLCDYVYAIGDEPRPGLVHVNLEEIPSFFEAIKDNGHDYVVVSSCSDFGLGYIAENPPWMDMRKWASMMIDSNLGFNALKIQPRYDAGKVNPYHKYSVKCYSYTFYTLPEIPSNVKKWFMTNSKIMPSREPVIEVIPFGVAGDSAESIHNIMSNLGDIEKEERVYVNWVNYTYERYLIKENFKILNLPYATVVDDAKPYEDYLVDLASHQYILSPEGNGTDCYRTLEAIYMSSLPIVMPSPTTLTLMNGLDIVVSRTLMGIPEQSYPLMKEYRQQNPSGNVFAKLSYWKQRFLEEKEKWF